MRNHLWALLALVNACAGGAVDDDGGPGDGGSTEVTGTIASVYWSDTDKVEVPHPLGSATIVALVPDGAGGFTSYPGTGADDGTFRIPGVPPGEYYFEAVGALGTLNMVIVTDLRVLDLRMQVMGRQGVTRPASQTNLVFNLTNLAAWQSGQDDMELFSVGAASYVLKIEEPQTYATTNYPTPGVTSVSNMTVDYRNTGQQLVDGSMGDRAFLTQLEAKTAGTTPYHAVTRAIEFPSFTMQEGQTTTLSGAMTTVPQTGSVAMSLKRSAWEALESVSLSGGQLVSLDARMVAGPADMMMFGGRFADLAFFGAAPGGTDVDLTMTYGDPFPSTWTRCFTVAARYEGTTMTPDGIAQPYALYHESHLRSATGTIALEPTLGPVMNPRINGTSAFANLQTGVGTSPTFSWENPALGTRTITYLLISRYLGGGNSEWLWFVGTQGNSVTIPPGVLQPGEWYMVNFQSNYNLDDPDASFGILQFSVPGAMSDVLSGFFQP